MAFGPQDVESPFEDLLLPSKGVRLISLGSVTVGGVVECGALGWVANGLDSGNNKVENSSLSKPEQINKNVP
jgi:hypothetical protein